MSAGLAVTLRLIHSFTAKVPKGLKDIGSKFFYHEGLRTKVRLP